MPVPIYRNAFCRLEKMSYFGKNIKKIRTVKKLSQSAFAELFDLKRGSIGAYEEERAEAKIDTIIRIAEYFKLSLNQLLVSELTINEIYHINKINSKLQSTKPLKKEKFIPFVSQTDIKDFINNHTNRNYLKKLPVINLPNSKQTNIAFECFDSSMLGLYSGIKQGDILLAQLIQYDELRALRYKTTLLVLTNKQLTMGFPETGHTQLTLSPLNLNFQKHFIPNNEIKKLWLVKQVITDTFIKDVDLGIVPK